MRTRALLLMFGAVGGFLAAGYGVLFTLLDEFRDEHGIGETWLGAVIGIGFFAGFLSQVIIAPLADRGQARRLVLAGMVLDVVGLVVMAFSTTIVALLVGRFVMGIGVGMAIPAIRRIVILSDRVNLGHNLGRLLAADVAGFAAGPAVSAVLAGPFGIPAPFLVIAGATLVLLPFVARTQVTETVEASAPRFAFDLLRLRPFAGAVAVACAVWLMIGSFDALWSLALDDLETAEWLANLGITLFALPLVVLGSLGGRLSQRHGPFRIATAGLLLGALYMTLYGFMPSGVAMFAVAMAHSLSDGLSVSSSGVAVGMVVPDDRQAGAQGVLGGIQTLVAGIAAPVIGFTYEHAGRAVAYPVAACAMVALLGGGLLLAGRAGWSMREIPDAARVDLADVTGPVLPEHPRASAGDERARPSTGP